MFAKAKSDDKSKKAGANVQNPSSRKVREEGANYYIRSHTGTVD